MAGGDKPLEDFVSILVKGDVNEYVVPTVSLVVMFLSHSSSLSNKLLIGDFFNPQNCLNKIHNINQSAHVCQFRPPLNCTCKFEVYN